MRYAEVTLDQAKGGILAHGVRVSDVSFKKGRLISDDDLASLRDAGVETLIMVHLEDGDVAEDTAADAVAAAASGNGVRKSAPFTGRSNLYATHDGIVVIERDRVNDINRIDESLTVATLPPYATVNAGQMLATVKVIPFSAPAAAVDACVSIAAGDGPLLRVAAYQNRRVGLVLTELGGTTNKVLDKTVAVTRARIEACRSTLSFEVRLEHTADGVADGINQALAADCDLVLVFGASAIVDRHDVIPAGLEAAGGTVEHFGMPVDPGNLLMLGRHGATPVIGLPGCARSPRINGFDWVLQRLCAGIDVTRNDLTEMGAGGLLKEITSRPQPREGGPATLPYAPRIAALVLAAGQSRRMGAINKMLVEADGAPMIVRTLDAVAASAAGPCVVVTGHAPDEVKASLAGHDVTFRHNPDYAEGLSTSLRVGLDALPDDIDGVVICLGDMPAVNAGHIDKLIAAFDVEEGRAICVPTYLGKRGNPVLWAAALFDDMRKVAGDVGARHLIGEHADVVCEVAVDDDAVLLDLDTPEALAAYAARSKT